MALSTGQVVRLLRTRRGISARALSAAAGLSPAYVTKLEEGALEPSLKAFARVAKALGMTPQEMVYVLTREAGETKVIRSN